MDDRWQSDSQFPGDVLNVALHGFTDVDAFGAQAYIEYLDAVNARSFPEKAALYKAEGIALGWSVLDLGCGTGEDLRALSPLVGSSGRVVGVDASKVMVDEVLKRGLSSNASVLHASVYHLPFPDADFDACRAERVFQHLERADDAAQEMRRVLKPGGRALLLDQDWETIMISGGDPKITRRVVNAFSDKLANGWAGRNHLKILRRAGFREVHVVAGVTSLPLGLAYAFVLQSALECAKAAGVITPLEANTWLAALLEADRRGEFYYGVSLFATLAKVS